MARVGDPNASVDTNIASLEGERLGQQIADPSGDRLGLDRVVEAFTQDNELVAAEAGDSVTRA